MAVRVDGLDLLRWAQAVCFVEKGQGRSATARIVWRNIETLSGVCAQVLRNNLNGSLCSQQGDEAWR